MLASGNTSCFMESLCRMIGTQGYLHRGERRGVPGRIRPAPSISKATRASVKQLWNRCRPITGNAGLRLPSSAPRTVLRTSLLPGRCLPDEVKQILKDYPVQVIDTGYAIHLQSPGINKGTAMVALAAEMGIPRSDFVAIGDSVNDIQMLKNAGIGLTVANAHPDTKAAAQYVAEKEYGDGFVEAIEKYFPYLRAR